MKKKTFKIGLIKAKRIVQKQIRYFKMIKLLIIKI